MFFCCCFGIFHCILFFVFRSSLFMHLGHSESSLRTSGDLLLCLCSGTFHFHLFACGRKFVFFFFPLVLLLCYPYRCVVVFMSLPFVARKSFISSSHLFVGLPTALHVLILVLWPGFHSAAFLAHVSFGSDVILIANRHFILLCVSIQHGILAAFIRSSASAVLLFLYSIQSSCSISGVPFSSSVSFAKETSLSWSQSVLELLPSTVSSSELLWHSFSSPPPFSFLGCLSLSDSFPSLLFCVFLLYFLFVCSMSRSILR